MRVSLFSHRFAPDIGGIETMSELLAGEFARQGHEVTVVTHTKLSNGDQLPQYTFSVLRSPKPSELYQVVKNSDVVFHNNICLQFVWPLFVTPRPWIVAVRTWIRRNSGERATRDRLKLRLLKRATVISISQAVANHLTTPSTVIPNSYRDDIFKLDSNVSRTTNSIIFAGRLVDDKGAALLIESLRDLNDQNFVPLLTIVGDGPQRAFLEDLVHNFRLDEQVTFLGSMSPLELATELNRHEIMVVPSIWDEPFGIVALEGIASGCVVIASDGGGLPDAVGPCGLLFSNGNREELTNSLVRLLTSPRLMEQIRGFREVHLASHTAKRMADRYLEVISTAAGSHQRRRRP